MTCLSCPKPCRRLSHDRFSAVLRRRPHRRHHPVARRIVPDGQLGWLPGPSRGGLRALRHAGVRGIRNRQEQPARRVPRPDDAVGHPLQWRLQRRRLRASPQRRPAQPDDLPQGQDRRQPGGRHGGAAGPGAARHPRVHLGCRVDDLHRRQPAPFHRVAGLLRAPWRHPVRRHHHEDGHDRRIPRPARPGRGDRVPVRQARPQIPVPWTGCLRHLCGVRPDPVHPPGHRRQRRGRQGAPAARTHPGRPAGQDGRRALQVDGA